jgi:hypothetical protein
LFYKRVSSLKIIIQPETRRSILIVKYTVKRTVYLLVLVQFAVQVTKHGMNIMKGTMCSVRKKSTEGIKYEY